MADSGTMAAWAALAAALLALVVALAQAAQQYAATAQDMKKCERSVWGPMPGYAGRRVFLWRQIRFRIVFDVPNIFIPTEYWEKPGNARQFPTHRITTLPAPFDPPSVNTDTESAIHNHSEACWVAFARQVSHVCPSAVRVGLMAGDADRLPADIPVVPMQVSLRDIIALGLMIGMNIQEANDDYIEMSGPFGFIKSSDHPILGRLIHFSAFSTTPHIKGPKTGDISKSWLRRLIGIASVANQQFDGPKRRSHASAMMRWRTNSTRIPLIFEDSDTRGKGEEAGELQLKFVDLEGKEHTVPADECSTWRDLVQFLESKGIATAPYIILGPENKAVAPKSWKPLLKVVRKGHLKTIFKIAEGDYHPWPLATASHLKSPSQEPIIKERTDQQIRSDTDNITEYATRALEGSASLTEAYLAESAESITHAHSAESIIHNNPVESIIHTNPLESITYADPAGSVIYTDPAESIVCANPAESITHADSPESIIHTDPTESITRADSPEPGRDISLDLFPQVQNTMERDGYFPSSRGFMDPANQTALIRIQDLWNAMKHPALTGVEDGVPGESWINGSRVRVLERPSPVRMQYRRPTVEDYSNGDSSSPSFSSRSSSRFRREERSGGSRSPNIRIRRRFSPPRVHRENRNGGSTSPSPVLRPRPDFRPRFRRENSSRYEDSSSASRHRESSPGSERNWRYKQTRAYASSKTRWVNPEPPKLTFYWASQIDIELGCWATPWGGGWYNFGIDVLGMLVDIGLAGLSQTVRLAQPKANRSAVDSNSNEIIYAEFPGPLILEDLWLHLREGQHTWPPYAINARGGVRGLATHSLVRHSAFKEDERLPQLTLLNSVHKARMSTVETSTASQVLERHRILELASIDFWLSCAATTDSISKGKSNLIIITPAIVEETWVRFFDEIMDTRKELWNLGSGDMHARRLANSISDFLSDFLGSPAELYFVWVAFLRAVKVMECVANGPCTEPALDIFANDVLVYLV
ncbi:uncharacterized protein Triagg1_160 [Trichoderma aggressivum f. europaeum]|uniref:Uncharacterized protein n=1 Tax=Trichoderma aggressivum f. europaeum TaxID=173218 RepID=A0AAE1ILL2_9HYPO|nr:hypothetical protein Triagg1_160 [Trichoderma aggressivum f. europaeum]